MKVRHVMGVGLAGVFLLTISLAAANTDVADAAMRKDRAGLQALLQKGANVNAAQADGARAIHWAVYNGDLEMTKMLIAAGARIPMPTTISSTCCSRPAKKTRDAG